jgi:hypothetical protein
VHGNNCDDLIDGSSVPRVLEVSFARRTLLDEHEWQTHSTLSYPVPGLDQPNDPRRQDYELRFSADSSVSVTSLS